MGSARHWRGQSGRQRPGAVVHARGRPRRTPRGWLSPAPKRREHQTHAARRLPHRSRLAPRATRHTYLAVVSQFPNNAITFWGGWVSRRRGCGVIGRRHRHGSRRSGGGSGRLNVYILQRCGTGRRLRHFRPNCRGRRNQRFPPVVIAEI